MVMKLGKSQYTFVHKRQVFQTQPQCFSPFQAQMFLKGKGSVLRHKKSIPKFGCPRSPERQPKKPQRVTLSKKIMWWVSFSTIIVCIIKFVCLNFVCLKFVFGGNVFDVNFF